MAVLAAAASGLKLANHELTVLVTGGDGDGFGIGCGHFVHAMRRNINLNYFVLDNQVYGLTTGQTSPTSRIGMKTKSNPYGNMDTPGEPDHAGAQRERRSWDVDSSGDHGSTRQS